MKHNEVKIYHIFYILIDINLTYALQEKNISIIYSIKSIFIIKIVFQKNFSIDSINQRGGQLLEHFFHMHSDYLTSKIKKFCKNTNNISSLEIVVVHYRYDQYQLLLMCYYQAGRNRYPPAYPRRGSRPHNDTQTPSGRAGGASR